VKTAALKQNYQLLFFSAAITSVFPGLREYFHKTLRKYKLTIF